MNLPDHLLNELADLGRLAAKQFQLTETGLADNGENFKLTHHKLDEWIQTNRAISESNRNLLQIITTNTEALMGLTTSYNNSISSWQDLRQQLRQFEQTINDLNSSLRALPQQHNNLSPEAMAWLEQQSMRMGQMAQQLERAVKAVQVQPLPAQGLSRPEVLSAQMLRPRLPGVSLSVELVRRATGPLAALGALLLMAGSGVGFAYAQVSQPPPLYVTDLQEPFTLEQADLLAWAMSQEGQFAKNLMDWNSGILDGGLTCTEEVERLGVTLKLQGRPASYGFCTIWVVAPNKRQFVAPE